MNKMTGRNEYRCHFCNKICKKGKKAEGYTKYARWHYCDNCPVQVWFAVGPMSKIKGILFSVKDKENKNKFHRMEINYKKKQTRLYKFESQVAGWYPDPTNTYLSWGQTYRTAYKETHILTLDKCVNNVTPDNVIDKIKMYILFS